MNCFTCENNLSAYIDDEIITDVRREIETHLDTCEKCHQEYETLLSSWELAGDMRTEAAPDSLWQAVEAELQQKGHNNTTTEGLALIVRGLASEIRDLKQTMESMRQDMETRQQGDGVRDRSRQGLGIWTGPGVGRARSDVG
ncbi:MAG: anti-sigma factor RsiW [Candidatus Latescibacterota bacterium]|jgi:anti-sigma factor RsiW